MSTKKVLIDYDVLKEYLDSGLTDTRIAQLLDVSQPAISYAKKRFGLQNNRSYKQGNYDVDQIKKLAEEGLSRPEISEKVGIHYMTITWICNKHNITTVKKRRKKQA